MKTLLRTAAIASIIFACSSTVYSSVLMLDFGSAAANGTTTELQNSPYHEVNGSFTDVSWNKVTVDVGSGLLYSDASSATGISVDVGDTASFGDVVLDLNSAVSTSGLGGALNTGIYANPPAIGMDGIFASVNGTRHVGFQIGGLAAGTYDVYLTGRNTSTSSAYTATFLSGSSSAAGNFNFSGYNSADLTYANSTETNTGLWSGNYVKMTVTLGANEYLNVAAVGSTGENRGFLNTAQIVSVPEPSSIVLLGMSILTAVLFFRRR